MAETPFERYLSSVKARVEAEKCPRCGGAKVHDFEHGCWVQDRCTECQATWFNDPPRLAGDALEGLGQPIGYVGRTVADLDETVCNLAGGHIVLIPRKKLQGMRAEIERLREALERSYVFTRRICPIKSVRRLTSTPCKQSEKSPASRSRAEPGRSRPQKRQRRRRDGCCAD